RAGTDQSRIRPQQRLPPEHEHQAITPGCIANGCGRHVLAAPLGFVHPVLCTAVVTELTTRRVGGWWSSGALGGRANELKGPRLPARIAEISSGSARTKPMGWC